MKLFGNSKKKRTRTHIKSRTGTKNSSEDLFSTKEKDVHQNHYTDKAPVPVKTVIYDDNPGEAETQRTPEELAEIDKMIAAYQKKKMIRRIVLLSVLIVIVIGAVVFVKAFVKAPEINQGGIATPKPASSSKPGQNTALPSESASLSPSPSLSPEPVSARKEGVYTFILIGMDQGNGNSDTMIIGMLDTVNSKLNFVSIPRDTLVNVPWGNKKVNSIYAFGDDYDMGDTAEEALKRGIRDLTGFTVDSYIVVDLEAFTATVDLIGGVNFYVPYNMDYDDPKANLHIHLSKGNQYLNGTQAVGLMRWRQNNDGTNYGDIVRINNQQAFIKTCAEQALSLGNYDKVREFAEIFKQYVKTDLTVGNIVWYGDQFLKLESDDISFFTVPENYNDSVRGGSYCTILVDEWVRMINETINPYKTEITAANLNILTKDSNGNLYSTSGEISGGYDSFLNYNELNANASSTSGQNNTDGSEKTDVPQQTDGTGQTNEPNSSETPSETDSSTDTSYPGESEIPADTDIPAQTDPPVYTDPPADNASGDN